MIAKNIARQCSQYDAKQLLEPLKQTIQNTSEKIFEEYKSRTEAIKEMKDVVIDNKEKLTSEKCIFG